LSKLSVITNSQYKKPADGKTQILAKTSHHVIYISRKFCHYGKKHLCKQKRNIRLFI